MNQYNNTIYNTRNNIDDKQNQKLYVLHSSQNNKKTKILGNSVILVANNMINQRKISYIKKLNYPQPISNQPPLKANKINLQYSLDNKHSNKYQTLNQFNKSKNMSNINLLKKQAQMLQEEKYLGKIRFSTSQFQLSQKANKILSNCEDSKFKNSQGQRKLFKGRAIFHKQNQAIINWRKMNLKKNLFNIESQLQIIDKNRARTSIKQNRKRKSSQQTNNHLKLLGFQRKGSANNCISEKVEIKQFEEVQI